MDTSISDGVPTGDPPTFSPSAPVPQPQVQTWRTGPPVVLTPGVPQIAAYQPGSALRADPDRRQESRNLCSPSPSPRVRKTATAGSGRSQGQTPISDEFAIRSLPRPRLSGSPPTSPAQSQTERHRSSLAACRMQVFMQQQGSTCVSTREAIRPVLRDS